MILLSILIPTIPERNEKFTHLYNELMRQKTEFDSFHDTIGELEILVNSEKRFLDGGISIGKKRESLVQQATGKYLCFCDDDDSVSPNYIESLMRDCMHSKDIVTFRAFASLANMWAIVDMSLRHKENHQMNPNYIVNRMPWPVCPVKSVYAKMFPFPDLNNAEDFVWMEQVLECCHTEIHSERVLYSYNHGEHSEADKIPLP